MCFRILKQSVSFKNHVFGVLILLVVQQKSRSRHFVHEGLVFNRIVRPSYLLISMSVGTVLSKSTFAFHVPKFAKLSLLIFIRLVIQLFESVSRNCIALIPELSLTVSKMTSLAFLASLSLLEVLTQLGFKQICPLLGIAALVHFVCLIN